MINSANNEVLNAESSLVRVVVYFKNGRTSTGTGFFVSEHGIILTCAHVITGADLKDARTDGFYGCEGETEYEKLKNFLDEKMEKISIETSLGHTKKATIVDFDEFYDIAELKVTNDNFSSPNFLALNEAEEVDFSDEIYFCGFPATVGYAGGAEPFAYQNGVVSSFPEVEIAGGKYKNVQLNAINLKGNSGAPFFKKGSIKLAGIINGNQTIKVTDLALYSKNDVLIHGNIVFPLPIAFATTIEILKEKVDFIKELIEN